MNRWKLVLVGLTLALSGVMGCKQKLYVSEYDEQHYKPLQLQFGAPSNLENDPTAAIVPRAYNIPEPPTVDKPDRPVRNMTLQECLAIALEQGNTGSQSALFPGIGNDNISASPNGGTFSDSIRVLALDPAIAGANIEAALSKFDARLVASTLWNKQDQGVINRFTSNSDSAEVDVGIYKPLPTGGLVGITFQTDYQKLNLVPNQANNVFTLTTSYRPRVMLQFEQPLWQSYGVEINQLLTNHPGTIQGVPGTQQSLRLPASRVEGILITRLRFEGAKADFEKNVNFMLLNAEYAYWNLYASYGSLYARDQALRDALLLLNEYNVRLAAGGVGVGAGGAINPADQFRVRAQVENFRSARLDALGTVFENERQLRSLLGMAYDGTRIVPVDRPTKAAFEPDWHEGVNEAIVNRPEITLARQDLKFRQFDLMLQRNSLKPDLRFVSTYDVNGVGRKLDGSTNEIDPGTGLPSPRNAFASLASNQFNSWSLGLRLDVPIGFRDAHAAIRTSRLNLYRSYLSMQDSERKVIDQLKVNYSRLSQYRLAIQANRAAAEAAEEQYKVLTQRRDIEANPLANTEAKLNAQQTMAAARQAEYTAIANYNNTLAGWEFAKGTILKYDNVTIADGALPQAAQIRAVDHIRERMKALEVREHPNEEHGVPGTAPIELDPAAGLLPAVSDPVTDVPTMMRNMTRPDSRIQGVPGQNLPAFGPTTAMPGTTMPK